MNCGKPVGQDEGKLFERVFVCPTCYALAESFYNRVESELKRRLFFLRDIIRVALVRKCFNASSASLTEEELRKLSELKEKPWSTP
jgi:hypothetical protein